MHILASSRPSSSSQSSQSSKPDLQLHKDIPNPHKNDPNGPGYDNYKNRTPPERDPNPTHGLNPPSVPGDPSYNTGPNHDAHVITVPVGKQLQNHRRIRIKIRPHTNRQRPPANDPVSPAAIPYEKPGKG